MANKNYLLFYGDGYYPNGGAFDLNEQFETIGQAHAEFWLCSGITVHDAGYDEVWAHVYCIKTNSIVSYLDHPNFITAKEWDEKICRTLMARISKN